MYGLPRRCRIATSSGVSFRRGLSGDGFSVITRYDGELLPKKVMNEVFSSGLHLLNFE